MKSKNKKNKFDFKLNVVKNVINRLDPIGLISQGAPKDEYDSEILKIVSIVDRYKNELDLGEHIYNIFVENFGQITAGHKDKYLNIAKNIFNQLDKRDNDHFRSLIT